MNWRREVDASTVFLTMTAIKGLLFSMMVVIYAPYLIIDAHLGPFQLVLLGTILEATILPLSCPIPNRSAWLRWKPPLAGLLWWERRLAACLTSLPMAFRVMFSINAIRCCWPNGCFRCFKIRSCDNDSR